MNPALVPPDRQGLASIDAEIVKRWVGTGPRKPRARKPARGKFVAAISHVLSAEDAEGKHFFRRQLGAKFRVEIAPRRRGEGISVAALHLVVDGYDPELLAIGMFSKAPPRRLLHNLIGALRAGKTRHLKSAARSKN